MIPFLFTPIGRYITIAAFALMVLAGIYVKIRSDAVSDYKAEATQEILERTQNAIRAGDNAVISPDRLLQDDGHRRD
jgi:hypothetical protein